MSASGVAGENPEIYKRRNGRRNGCNCDSRKLFSDVYWRASIRDISNYNFSTVDHTLYDSRL